MVTPGDLLLLSYFSHFGIRTLSPNYYRIYCQTAVSVTWTGSLSLFLCLSACLPSLSLSSSVDTILPPPCHRAHPATTSRTSPSRCATSSSRSATSRSTRSWATCRCRRCSRWVAVLGAGGSSGASQDQRRGSGLGLGGGYRVQGCSQKKLTHLFYNFHGTKRRKDEFADTKR